MSNNELIYSPETIEVFLENVFPLLGKHEAVYVSLSTRTKYLSEEDREIYSLSKKEMFHRRYFTREQVEKGDILEYLYGVRIEEQGGRYCLSDFTDKRGNLLPVDATTVYININPVDLRSAALALQCEISAMISKDISGQEVDFAKIPSLYSTEVQRSRARRNWIDVDFDFNPGEKPQHFDMINSMEKYFDHSLILSTRSGYHVMLNPKQLKDHKINLEKVLNAVRTEYSERYKEIGSNRNAMVPLPGTYQAGQKVEWV